MCGKALNNDLCNCLAWNYAFGLDGPTAEAKTGACLCSATRTDETGRRTLGAARKSEAARWWPDGPEARAGESDFWCAASDGGDATRLAVVIWWWFPWGFRGVALRFSRSASSTCCGTSRQVGNRRREGRCSLKRYLEGRKRGARKPPGNRSTRERARKEWAVGVWPSEMPRDSGW